jgi:hypothetical protein
MEPGEPEKVADHHPKAYHMPAVDIEMHSGMGCGILC